MAQAVIFDVDGTLVDSNYLHAVTWWEAFRQYGHDVAMADVHRTIGMGSDKLLDRLLPGDRVITASTSSDDADQSKPAPDIVEVALSRAGVRAEDAVFVGDTVWDVHACRRAGLPCVAVLTGGVGRDELREAGAVEIHESPADLLAHLDDSVVGRLAG